MPMCTHFLGIQGGSGVIVGRSCIHEIRGSAKSCLGNGIFCIVSFVFWDNDFLGRNVKWCVEAERRDESERGVCVFDACLFEIRFVLRNGQRRADERCKYAAVKMRRNFILYNLRALRLSCYNGKRISKKNGTKCNMNTQQAILVTMMTGLVLLISAIVFTSMDEYFKDPGLIRYSFIALVFISWVLFVTVSDLYMMHYQMKEDVKNFKEQLHGDIMQRYVDTSNASCPK